MRLSSHGKGKIKTITQNLGERNLNEQTTKNNTHTLDCHSTHNFSLSKREMVT